MRAAGPGVPRKRSSVRFVEDSPVLTPSWKSAAWNRAPAAPSRGQPGGGQLVERSPELRGGARGGAVEGDAEWEGAEAQADREWCAGPAAFLHACPYWDPAGVHRCTPLGSGAHLLPGLQRSA